MFSPAETILLAAATPMAEAAAALRSANNGFVLISAALVLMMTPALALFYAGFVRSRNVLNTMVMSFSAMALVSVLWVLFGYSLAFSPGSGPLAPFIGGLAWAGLSNWSAPFGDGQISHGAVALFQTSFAIITPALISGAVVERMNFRAWILFVLFWSTLIYIPLAHMVWGPGGFLGADGLGALDFAGGLVVELASGVAAAVAAVVVGRRRTYPDHGAPPHNVPFILMGTGLLWFGWFGFNGGSGLVAGNLASLACLTTNTAGAAAALGWMLIETWQRGKPTAVGVATGAVAGLVAITPAAGFVSPLAAVLIGFAAAALCSWALQLKLRLRLDDTLDVLPVHGMAGLLGTLLTGVFTLRSLNPAGADGVIAGRWGQLWIQLQAVGFTVLWVGVGTYALLVLLRLVIPLRVTDAEERQGVDINAHGEEAYNSEFTS
ncbi:ammonium transporter [Vulcanococcus limneticus]|uniref:ammonium transporter n=1 Tax=Vulcanococcus limneticus TaxID=2170428 RepID=UPI00398BC415